MDRNQTPTWQKYDLVCSIIILMILRPRGFTLVELLVVIGVLVALLAVVALAVNPYEQLSRASDVSSRAIAEDLIKSDVAYYAAVKKQPWEKNSLCSDELNSGKTLAEMPNCVEELSGGGRIKEAALSMPELKQIYMSRCGDTAVLCYSPKSKVENLAAETKYDKFGVSIPGCPGKDGTSPDCYWCRPFMKSKGCSVVPTPTVVPTDTPIPPTATLAPTMAPTPTTIPYMDLVLGYKIDDSKFFQTYAVYFFDYPGFPPSSGQGWNMQLSTRSDFGGIYTETINSFGIPDHYCQDAPANVSYTALRKITKKYVGITSIIHSSMYPYTCGNHFYWRITNFYNPNYANKLTGPVYTGVVDCNTKVGVVDPPLSWYTVFDQGGTNKQKQYSPLWDFDHSGEIDWTDYWLGAFSTKFRAGGWQPPE